MSVREDHCASRSARDALAQVHSALAEAARTVGNGETGLALHVLDQKRAEALLNLVVLGQFKRGKSTLINAILGADVLPVAVVPATSVVTVIEAGESAEATVYFSSGAVQPVEMAEIAAYATEAANPGNRMGVERIVIRHPSTLLRSGVRLIDTPGIGSVHNENTAVTMRFLPQADAAILVLSVDPPMTAAEQAFLRELAPYAARLFAVLNKADYMTAEAVADCAAFNRSVLSTELAGADVPLYPCSALRALQGKREGDPAKVTQSGLPVLEADLQRFAACEASATLERSLLSGYTRLTRQLTLAVGAELAALDQTRQELGSLRDELDRLLQAAHSEVDALGPLVRAERDRLVRRLDEQLRDFRQAAHAQALEAIVGQRLDTGGRGAASRARAVALEAITAAGQRFIQSWNPSARSQLEEARERLGARAGAIVSRYEGAVRKLLALPMAESNPAQLVEFRGQFELDLSRTELMLIPEAATVLDRLPGTWVAGWARRLALDRARQEADRAAGQIRAHAVTLIEQACASVVQSIVESLSVVARELTDALRRASLALVEGVVAGEARREALRGCLKRLRQVDAGLLAGDDIAAAAVVRQP